MNAPKTRRSFSSWLWGSFQDTDEHEYQSERGFPVPYVPLGRLVHRSNEENIKRDSDSLTQMIFGQNLRHAPEWWKGATAVGIVSRELQETFSEELVSLSPGWSYGVLNALSPSFFVIETRAFETGLWACALSPGSEHLFDEISTLTNLSQRKLITVILIDNAELDVRPARSFTLASSLSRLRRATPGSLDSLANNDPYAIPLSGFLSRLDQYLMQEV
ncbi:hypothetical protein ACN081_04725 [Rothia sp. P13129]|uniref:hypothetical protein n=1 Tax=Rothia sp. P13129 TaxID=3402664 RepID=UPI003AC5FDFF